MHIINQSSSSSLSSSPLSGREDSKEEEGEEEEARRWDEELHMPPWIPPAEKAQVSALIDGFVRKLLVCLSDLRTAVRRR